MNQKEIIFENEEDINIKEILFKYLKYWPYYIIFAILAFVFAFIYLKYQPNIYQINASVLVKNKSNPLSDIGTVSEMFSQKDQVEDEIQIIKSLPVLTKVVNNIGLQVNYYFSTKYSRKKVEYYNNSPIKIEFFNDVKSFPAYSFVVHNKSKNSFKLEVNDSLYGSFPYNKRIAIDDDLSILVKQNKEFFDDIRSKTYVDYISEEVAAMRLIKDLNIESASKVSNTILLSLESTNLNKAKDIINDICQQYFKNTIEDRSHILRNTGEFIKERIVLLDSELKAIENDIKNYKQSNKLTDIITQSQLYANNAEKVNQKLLEAELQLNLVKSLNRKINSNNYDVLPVNQGLNDQTINSSIAKYNELVLEFKNLTLNTTDINPNRITQENAIKELLKSIISGLNNQKGNLEMVLKQTQIESSQIDAKLVAIPSQEKEIRDILRQHNTKEALFLYLLQKREELAISETTLEPNARLVNYAHANTEPIAPKKKIIVLLFLLISVMLTTLIIYLKNLFDTKIHSLEFLERKSSVPNIGIIPKYGDIERKLLNVDDRSSTAEALRLVITNSEFILSDIKGCKTILTTSALSGEGKSFISANIASYLAYSGKKVILLGFDLRAPKLHEFFDYDNELGITHYIRKKEINFEDIIVPIKGYDKFDIIHSGITVPNFVELMKNSRIEELFVYLKTEYDYIIIDSAPVGLVSDTLNLSKYCDTTMFVIRAHYLDKALLNISNKLFKENKLPNMKTILNAVDMKKSSYGYGYGYGYGLTYGYGNEEENINEKYKFKPWYKGFWTYWLK